MSPSPTRREWMIVVAVAFLATALMQVPYVLGYATARPETEYTGLLVSIEDFTYQGIMLQGYNGAWQYHVQYTPEEHSPVFLHGFYLALGHLARALGLSIPAMWFAARIGVSLLLVVCTFGFISAFLPDRKQRWVAFLLAVFGAGFDWALLPGETFDVVGSAPIEFRMPEAHVFFGALTFPHFSMGVVLILATIHFALEAFERDDLKYALAAGFSNLLLVVVYPFLVFLVAVVLGGFWLVLAGRARKIPWRESLVLAITFSIPGPLVVYYAVVIQTNPVFRIWNEQVATLSPNPVHYLLAYGAMLALGLLGLRRRRSEPVERAARAIHSPSSRIVDEYERPPNVGAQAGHPKRMMFLWVWIVVAFVLLYAPLNMQRRFVEGLQVPLAIVASIGLVQVALPWLKSIHALRKLATRRGYSASGLAQLAIVLFLILMSSSNLVILATLSIQNTLVQPEAFFRPLSEIRMTRWLREHSAVNDVTFSDYWTGSLIPVRAGNSVFVGNRYETNRFADRMTQVETFFDAKTSDDWRRELLGENRVKYLVWGERERQLGGFDATKSTFLDCVYSDNDMMVFQYTGKY